MDDLEFTVSSRDKICDPAIAHACFKSHGKSCRLAEGDAFFADDEKSENMYLLLEGEVRLFRGVQVLDIVRAGEIFFGEMALVNESPRAASAIALTDVRLLPISRHDFMNLVTSHPAFTVSLLKMVAARLARHTAKSV